MTLAMSWDEWARHDALGLLTDRVEMYHGTPGADHAEHAHTGDGAGMFERERVVEAAVVGMPSEEWGETPVAFVVLTPGADAESVRADCNAKVGKTQRLRGITVVDELPRSAIGKVLKRELRDAYAG